jgi:hypothetical protein
MKIQLKLKTFMDSVIQNSIIYSKSKLFISEKSIRTLLSKHILWKNETISVFTL